MKKKVFLVSTLVAMAMSAMFVACSSKNDPGNGMCTCSNGEEVHYVNPASEGVNSCAALNAIANDGVRCW